MAKDYYTNDGRKIKGFIWVKGHRVPIVEEKKGPEITGSSGLYNKHQVEQIVNGVWVNGNHSEITHNPDGKNAKLMEKVLPYLPAYKGEVYRGSEEKWGRDTSIGSEFSFEHLTAWSRNKNIADMHAEKHEYAPIMYRVKNPKQARAIDKISNKPEEEVLMSKDAVYKVVNVSQTDLYGRQVRLVDLEEVDRRKKNKR